MDQETKAEFQSLRVDLQKEFKFMHAQFQYMHAQFEKIDIRFDKLETRLEETNEVLNNYIDFSEIRFFTIEAKLNEITNAMVTKEHLDKRMENFEIRFNSKLKKLDHKVDNIILKNHLIFDRGAVYKISRKKKLK